jgi:hypothetical protein
MLYGKYNFCCRFESDAVLPHYKGSTFRGVFGHALKKVVCALRHQECANCLLKTNCVYAFVFETQHAVNLPENIRAAAPPPPFIIEPPLTTETFFETGSFFDFSLILFGEINHSLPYFIYAMDQMGQIGIGKKVDRKRGNFRLMSVHTDEGVIYSETDKTLKPGWMTEQLEVNSGKDPSGEEHRVKVTLETPLRLKFQNKFKADLPFHVLVRAMLRRISLLFSVYDKAEPPLDYRELISAAEKIGVAGSNLDWYDWKRYSQRQDQKMFMGGMTGNIIYQGPIGKFFPLLETASKVHLGKQTTFGLGKISVGVVN